MAEEIEQFKQLQAGMNAAFDGLIKSFQEGPNNGKATAATKGQVVTMAQMTLGAVLGPAFSLIGLSSQVSSRIDVYHLARKAHMSSAPCICSSADCARIETFRDCQQAHEPR
jgi:hypothetical protein